MLLPTVKIKHGDGWIKINKQDFDPETQELWSEPPADEPEPTPEPEPEQKPKRTRRGK